VGTEEEDEDEEDEDDDEEVVAHDGQGWQSCSASCTHAAYT
jgi:hypothetical protein